MDTDSQKPDLEELLAKFRPPSVPDDSIHRDNTPLRAVITWRKGFVVSTLSGLLTDPNYYANGIRLDWLQRLTLSRSIGERRPKPQELGRALNAGLDNANVLRLEDPQEDLFCDLIATHRGNFRIFTGHWETPGPYTQTLLHAFEALPAFSQKTQALESVYSLLTISDELAQRSSVHRLTEAGGEPQGVLAIPDSHTLSDLAQRVRFSNSELHRLGVRRDTLTPCFLEPQHLLYVGSMMPGDSPLEFYPLIANKEGITIASPAAISLAARAILVGAAQRGGVDKRLLLNLLIEQELYTQTSGFWPTSRFRLSNPDRYFLRNVVFDSGNGRMIQVIQVPPTFDQFPQKAFASVRTTSGNVSKLLADLIAEFWRMTQEHSQVRESATVLLLSGWGAPHSVEPPIDHQNAPHHWQFIPLSFASVATLGVCENGRLFDIQRILRQVDLLEREGFTFRNMNGILNLFGFWRRTNGNLIPEHVREIVPPCNVVIPTDELLAPRIEAARKQTCRAFPCPDGSYKFVVQDGSDNLQPIYASPEEIAQGKLVGAIQVEDRTWWVEVENDPNTSGEWRYRIWEAVLQWLGAVGRFIVERLPDAFPPIASHVSISIPQGESFLRIDPSRVGEIALVDTIVASRSPGEHAIVKITADWLSYLGSVENVAESLLVADVLRMLAASNQPEPSREELQKAIAEAVGSQNWRWLHARESFTPLDRLAHSRLIQQFREIPLSAFSVTKCGSTWEIRDHLKMSEIDGEEECKKFLAQYREHILNELISRIREFDKGALVSAAAEQYQAARAEQSQWRNSIRAMRAIRGAEADKRAFNRQNAINAVQRASKSIMEVAACEASLSGGLQPDRSDLEEMFALALLLFGNGQLFAAIRAGLIKPNLRISPAGDLLSDRSAIETAFTPAVQWSVTKALNESDQRYGERMETRTADSGDRMSIAPEVRKAAEEEYGVSAEAFADLQYAVVQMAEIKESGVFTLRKSELLKELRANTAYPSRDPSTLLERFILPWRSSWGDIPSGCKEADFELSRFDRPYSLISRPLLALEGGADALLLISPVLISDATMYSLSGLIDGSLQNQFWVSKEAKSHVGRQAEKNGRDFEERVAAKLRTVGLPFARTRCPLSWALNDKVSAELGDIDVLAVSPNKSRVWVVEAKDLRLCRTDVEIAARLSEYRGRMTEDHKGRQQPDKMLRHIRRVQYLRMHREKLCNRLKLPAAPEVRGLLIVDSPQPMNFYMLEKLEDGESTFLDAIDTFRF